MMINQRLQARGTLARSVEQLVEGRSDPLLGRCKRVREKNIASSTGGYWKARQHLPKLLVSCSMDELIERLRSRLAESGPRLPQRVYLVEMDTAGDIGLVVVDATRVKQIPHNYVSNALKFTPEGVRGAVKASLAPPDHFLLEVKDTGIGTRAEHIGRLFQQFQQLDDSAAKQHEGTGLGLALTKRIVEAQGGRVRSRSTPGEGSTFHALLPCMFRERPAVPDAGLPQCWLSGAAPRALRGGRTMGNEPLSVVDDNALNLKLVRLLLGTEGCHVGTAEHAPAAEGRPVV